MLTSVSTKDVHRYVILLGKIFVNDKIKGQWARWGHLYTFITFQVLFGLTHGSATLSKTVYFDL